ncbi:MAG: hypothetical protein ACTHKP_00540 [Nitrososphaeraceae archaeon]
MTSKGRIIFIIAAIAISAVLITTSLINQDAFAKCKKYRGHDSSTGSSQARPLLKQTNVEMEP